MALNILWSDQLERLAEHLFRETPLPHDPFQRTCTIVGTPLMASWLKHYYLYQLPPAAKKQHVLANWDFPNIHPFVNDWMAKIVDHIPLGQRNPAQHPYAKEVLLWRIWNQLQRTDEPDYQLLYAYIGNAPLSADRKRFGLAEKIAQLFDDYQNFRPRLLRDWEQGLNTAATEPQFAWQPRLWRALIAENPNSYLRLNQRIQHALMTNTELHQTYAQLSVFHLSTLPPAYITFFTLLARHMDVTLYVFNPSQEFWLDDPTQKQHLKQMCFGEIEARFYDPPHPLLSAFARGTQAYLSTLLDHCDEPESDFGPNQTDSLLHALQAEIRQRAPHSGQRAQHDDGSIQLHICHSPAREVEVAKDLILRWFETHPESQPRDVQVLVADLATYAPFIDATFKPNDPSAVIPCTLSKRPPVSAGTIAHAFITLLKINESRMTASACMDLLSVDPIREAYGLTPDDLAALRNRIDAVGIRWGRDADHLQRVIGAPIPDNATWRHGLDRLLVGLAIGPETASGKARDFISAGALETVLPYIDVEGDAAKQVGTLARFFADLESLSETLNEVKSLADWGLFLQDLLARFFADTETSLAELTRLRRTLHTLVEIAPLASNPLLSSTVIAVHVESSLAALAPAGNCVTNTVLFTPLQSMQATPRKLILLLGLNEGTFPRTDQRVAFDLLGVQPHFGDRSLRHEDRLAFLEALLCAREQLIITYQGRSTSDNHLIPPSPVVTELMHYLDGSVTPIEQRLQGFNPAYFSNKGPLFSYSHDHYVAALARATQTPACAVSPLVCPDLPAPQPMEHASVFFLADLQTFFQHPAKYYYTQCLELFLRTEEALHDEECFTLDGLASYTLKCDLVDVLLNDQAREPEPSLYRTYQENGALPLGSYGLAVAQHQKNEACAFLETRCTTLPATYRELLYAQQRATPQPFTIALSAGTVHGAISLQTSGPHAVHLVSTLGALSTKLRVTAWLAHIAGHAAGLSFQTLLLSKKPEEETCFAPLDRMQAQRALEAIVHLFTQGKTYVLPITPDSAIAFIEKMNSAESVKQEDARAAAAQAFATGYEPEDPYYQLAWKTSAPTDDARFCACAETLLADYRAVRPTGVPKKARAKK